ncbi:hypothetical protein [Algoriphagus halophytocola]|uniref:Glycosyltransferase RgtA/B/C/D-like domain-containing protein n=1 Tax=Algoriphagus halophytocola TaxID=2991499 RepID=A0ABY6MJE5_9BACT|nr:hypothetical protein [Algoriphagus sp. TR-M5]UZD23895.1 hypothetical protein OM944_05235 [Algoriphagus sp. TR-M5]
MSLKGMDYLVLALCNLPVLYFLRSCWANKAYTLNERILLVLLWLVHLTFSGVFASYILERGGDSHGLWHLTADTSQYAQDWMGYFGINTFFVQWLNYFPSKILGLSYWSGTFIYSTLSFGAIALLFFSFRQLIQQNKESLSLRYLLYLPLFLPGLHFWTAGVTKECLLLLGLALLFYAFGSQKFKGLPGILGWAICLLTRPLVGIFFLPLLIWLLYPFFKKSLTKTMLVLFGLGYLLFKAIRQFLAYLHLDELSWESLMLLSKNQFGFLDSFQSSTAVPMTDMNLSERMVAVFFRPFIWETWDFYSLIFALENTWFMLIMLVALLVIIWRKSFNIPFIAKYYLIIAFGMFLVFTFTLNNFGLFYRMKSIWLPFLQFPMLWLICKAYPHLKKSP